MSQMNPGQIKLRVHHHGASSNEQRVPEKSHIQIIICLQIYDIYIIYRLTIKESKDITSL
jgi:hypothetical protein